jgi:hypothetical protein
MGSPFLYDFSKNQIKKPMKIETIIPSNYKEASGVQLHCAAMLVYQLKIALHLIPPLPPIGSPNYNLVEVTDTDFKPLPTDDVPILAVLQDAANISTFAPLLAGVLTISTSDAELLLLVYTHKVIEIISKLSSGLLFSVRQDVLIDSGAVPLQSITLYDDFLAANVKLSLNDDLTEYPTFIIDAVLSIINGRYDLLAVLPSFLAMLLRTDTDTELTKDKYDRYELNPIIEPRNTRLLQMATGAELIGLYLFFCQYTKIQTLYWRELSQTLGGMAK